MSEEQKDREQIQERIEEEPDFVPVEVEDEARNFGLDTDDEGVRSILQDMLMDDPDLFGDWDRFQ